MRLFWIFLREGFLTLYFIGLIWEDFFKELSSWSSDWIILTRDKIDRR